MSSITKVKANAEELASGRWTPDHLREIMEAMHTDGIAVIENVVSEEHLAKLNEWMVPDAIKIRKNATRTNFGTENVQQAPPLHIPELAFDDFYLNPLLFEVISHTLGPGAKWDFISGNTAMPHSTQRQPVHSDEKCDYMQRTFYVVANIPLIDMSIDNGVTEFWPGTHRLRSLDNYNPATGTLKQSVLDERRKTHPPVQPAISKGSIVIRDLMLWHCGTANPSSDVRCMSALGFSAQWWLNDARFKVPSLPVAERLQQGAAKLGIQARCGVDTDYAAQKDTHDFNLHERQKNDLEGREKNAMEAVVAV